MIDKEDEDFMNDLVEHIKKQEKEYLEEKKEYLLLKKEQRVKYMCDKTEGLIALFAYHWQFRGDGTLEKMATYEWYENHYFSEVENKEENYIEFLKCYIKGCESAVVNEFEDDEAKNFIKMMCKQAGIKRILDDKIK